MLLLAIVCTTFLTIPSAADDGDRYVEITADFRLVVKNGREIGIEAKPE